MKTNQHAERAERVIRSMKKLEAGEYEMLIEGAMIAGTHLFNACLHRLGITDEQDDVMHAEYLTGHLRIKIRLLEPGLVELLDKIEQLRPAYVRGDFDNGEVAAGRCTRALQQLQERVRALH